MQKLWKLVDYDGSVHRAPILRTFEEGGVTTAMIVGSASDLFRACEGAVLEVVPDALKVQPRLCSATVIHAYTNLSQAYLCDMQHCCRWKTGRIFEAEGEVVVGDATKVGCRKITFGKERFADKRPKVDQWTMLALVEALFQWTEEADPDGFADIHFYEILSYCNDRRNRGQDLWEKEDWMLGDVAESFLDMVEGEMLDWDTLDWLFGWDAL